MNKTTIGAVALVVGLAGGMALTSDAQIKEVTVTKQPTYKVQPVDEGVEKQEVEKVVEKTFTVEQVQEIKPLEQLEKMYHDKGDIESIMTRFNGAVASYNEARANGLTIPAISEVTCTFPTLPALPTNEEVIN